MCAASESNTEDNDWAPSAEQRGGQIPMQRRTTNDDEQGNKHLRTCTAPFAASAVGRAATDSRLLVALSRVFGLRRGRELGDRWRRRSPTLAVVLQCTFSVLCSAHPGTTHPDFSAQARRHDARNVDRGPTIVGKHRGAMQMRVPLRRLRLARRAPSATSPCRSPCCIRVHSMRRSALPRGMRKLHPRQLGFRAQVRPVLQRKRAASLRRTCRRRRSRSASSSARCAVCCYPRAPAARGNLLHVCDWRGVKVVSG